MSGSCWSYVWMSIHSIAIAFNPKQEDAKESFICIFQCLVDLLPDKFARDCLISFMKQTPIIDYLNVQNGAFEWTYRLHVYINMVKSKQGMNTDMITYSTACKKFSTITKKDWGSATWNLIHYIAANLPQTLTSYQQESFVAFIVCLNNLLPCENCRNHMEEYTKNNDIYPHVNSGGFSVFKWTNDFHNDVNKRLGTKIVSLKDAFNMFKIPKGRFNLI